MTPTAQPSCLVTGAHGFLGSRIVAEFGSAGYRTIGVDRGGALPQGGGSGLDTYFSMDLPSPALADLLTAEAPDVIVHTAGPASVADSMIRPIDDFHGTVGVLLGLLDAVRLGSPRSRVVILSSAAVYGNPTRLPVREDAEIAPVSPYGFHKRISEDLLQEYAQVYGVRSCAARVFSAYGPGLRRQLMWDVCQKGLAGPQVTLFGTGEETRDFIHVADVASAVRTLAQKADMNGEPYNVASGVQTTIASIADSLVAQLGPDHLVSFSGEQRPGDPLYWQADVSAIAALGFSQRVTLSDGVAQYARWCLQESGK